MNTLSKKNLHFNICLILVRPLLVARNKDAIQNKKGPIGSHNQTVEKIRMELHQEGIEPRHQCHSPSLFLCHL